MKTFATHWAATSLELCLNNDFYETHPFIETKIIENPAYHTKIQYLEWQSRTKLEKNRVQGKKSINKYILREAMYNTSSHNWGTLLCMLALSSWSSNQICLSVNR